MPTTVPPSGRVPLYARDPATGAVYLIGGGGGGAKTIDELTDVDTSTATPLDGDTLVWESSTGQWVPATPIRFLDDLDDVDLTTDQPEDSDALVFDSASNTWVPVAMPSEVFVGPDEPAPGLGNQAWLPSDESSAAATAPFLPLDGSAPMTANINFADNMDGIVFQGGGQLYGNGANVGVNGVLQWPNIAEVPKLHLYSTTFGLGIESGTLTLFASSNIRFRKDSIAGERFAEINAAGLHIDGTLNPSTTANVSWQNNFSGTATCRYTPAVCTIRLTNVSRTLNCEVGVQTKMFDYPSGFPAPPDVQTGYRTVAFERNDNFSRDNSARMITLHFDGSAAYLIATGDIFYNAKKFDAVITWAR